MTARSRQLMIMLVAMIMVGSASLLVPMVASAATASAPDGASVTGPDEVVVGDPIVITGTGWTAPSGDGSVIAVKLDDGGLSGRTAVTNPATGQQIANLTVFAIVQAAADGTFTLSVPFPTTANATGTWPAGTEHGLRLLTGSLLT